MKSERSFLRRYWHLFTVILSLVVALTFVCLGITQVVLGLRNYPDWIVVLWTICNLLFFLDFVLLLLPQVSISLRISGPTSQLVFPIAIYILSFLVVVCLPNPLLSFSFLGLISFFSLLVGEIIEMYV